MGIPHRHVFEDPPAAGAVVRAMWALISTAPLQVGIEWEARQYNARSYNSASLLVTRGAAAQLSGESTGSQHELRPNCSRKQALSASILPRGDT